MDWKQVLWTDEVPLTIGKDGRRHWILRRKMESLKPRFTLPLTPQGKQLMLWSVIGYNHKGPLMHLESHLATPKLRYQICRLFCKSAAKGINGPKYTGRIL